MSHDDQRARWAALRADQDIIGRAAAQLRYETTQAQYAGLRNPRVAFGFAAVLDELSAICATWGAGEHVDSFGDDPGDRSSGWWGSRSSSVRRLSRTSVVDAADHNLGGAPPGGGWRGGGTRIRIASPSNPSRAAASGEVTALRCRSPLEAPLHIDVTHGPVEGSVWTSTHLSSGRRLTIRSKVV